MKTFIIIILSFLLSYNIYRICKGKEISSVYIVNGKYKIQSDIIIDNRNLKTLLIELEKAELTEKRTMAEVPVFIKTFLNNLTDTFVIADPGEEWQSTDMIFGREIQGKIYDEKIKDSINQIRYDESQPLPRRKLIYFGNSNEIALMSYYTGGIGMIQHILVIKFHEEKITDFWCGYGMIDDINKKKVVDYLKQEENINYNEIKL